MSGHVILDDSNVFLSVDTFQEPRRSKEGREGIPGRH